MIPSVTNSSQSKASINCGVAYNKGNNIVQFNLHEDYTLELEDIKDVTNTIGKLNGGKKSGVLFVCGDYSNVAQDVIKDSLNPNNFKYTKADAFVVKSFHQRLLANFYISVVRPPVPTKYFDSEDEALKWLRNVI